MGPAIRDARLRAEAGMPRPSVRHTYGSECRLAPVAYPTPDSSLEGIPAINAQFFYSSPVPIDDPLSTATVIGAPDGRSAKHVVRPFSQGDNNALEKAWLAFSSAEDRQNHQELRRNPSLSPILATSTAEALSAIVDNLVTTHRARHGGSGCRKPGVPTTAGGGDVGSSPCCPELVLETAAEIQRVFCAVIRQRTPALEQDTVVQEVMLRLRATNSLRDGAASPATLAKGSSTSANALSRSDAQGPERALLSAPSVSGVAIPARVGVADDGISGQPFVRVGTPETPLGSTPVSVSRPDMSARGRAASHSDASDVSNEPRHRASKTPPPRRTPRSRPGGDSIDVPVGVSRLHTVSLPNLQMKPIYWSPVNDIAVVLRSTWFYRDTYLPVDAAIANQLEAGYRELRPWTETWADELRCAVEVGALGEEKVSHALWPRERGRDRDREGSAKKKEGESTGPPISGDPFCAARCFQGEAAAEGTLEPVGSDQAPVEASAAARPYSSYHVIYSNASRAFLLKPSLRPSAYYGRRPVAKLARGITVGIPVVRGFDRQIWDRLHHKRKEPSPTEMPAALAGDDPQAGHGLTDCPGCRSEKERNQVTDLILVAHGVGQKLAERVESFHFTHAINAFRRDVNLALASDAVRPVLRDDFRGIMILPLNWRSTVSFLDMPPQGVAGETQATEASADVVVSSWQPPPEVGTGLTNNLATFRLKDIEPDTIPVVRSLISDVMLDIPFYMSNLKPRMIRALVAEANRIYRLWAQNNPGFADAGRVHLIGHSLGSAMAIEILSRQPTAVPRLDPSRNPVPGDFFEFDTKNLFLLGSPAGFFLLLERGRLMPRRGRLKPGADAADTVAEDVVGDRGSFGCLAVDNIYNILVREDPIAYLLNGTVDAAFAAGLKTAYVPSSTAGVLASLGRAVRGYLPGAAASPVADVAAKPPTVRLPSQLELEVHDFTREEIAEKKAFLLNDNGQLDYFLRSGGGPLEIQYLNMLSAHTSYWTNQDFVNMLCVEVGREPGRANTIPDMRAVKATKRFNRAQLATTS